MSNIRVPPNCVFILLMKTQSFKIKVNKTLSLSWLRSKPIPSKLESILKLVNEILSKVNELIISFNLIKNKGVFPWK